MKKTIIMMLLALVTFCASAETYSYLRFTLNDSSEVAYSVDEIVVTYDETNVYINNADGSYTLALTDLAKMYFSNDGTTSEGETHLAGDVNHDGEVNISDVTKLIDRVLADTSIDSEDDRCCEDCCDVNGDGGIDISDVTALIDLVLSSNK